MSNQTIEGVKTINSAIRTAILLGFLGIFSYFGWAGYNQWIRPGLEAEKIKAEMAALQLQFERQQAELVKTQTALKLLKVDRRRAYIDVLETGFDNQTEEPFFVAKFTEVDPEGVPLSEPRTFRLRGNLLFVDSWIVKFDDEHVEASDPLRSTSLCLFKSIYGDLDERSGGYPLDQNDPNIATAYGDRNPQNQFEEQIWNDFWELANDPQQQNRMGIRSNHGTVSYIQVLSGMTYQVDLRASDGLSLKVTEKKQNTNLSSATNAQF